MDLFFDLLAAFTLSGFLSFALIPLAWRLKLVDQPNARKHHHGQVPLVGGLTVFISTMVIYAFCFSLSIDLRLFMIAAALMVFIGVLDDRYDLSVRIRILAQVLVATIIVFGAETYITTLGNILGSGEIGLSATVGMIFTVLAIMAAMNAYNMVDGIDGLLGTLALIAFLGIAVLGTMHDQYFTVAAAIVIVGALLPFIMRNTGVPFKKARKIFMGDAGSMFIGLAIVWLLALLTNPGHINDAGSAVRPVAVLWLIAVPLMDMLAIMFRRLQKGQSPFKPDRDHLHHIFMRAGFQPRQALGVIALIAVLLAGFGLLLEVANVPEYIVAALYVLVFIAYCYMLKYAWRLVKWWRSVRGIEKSAQAQSD